MTAERVASRRRAAVRALDAWRARWFAPAPLSDLAIARVLLAVTVVYLNSAGYLAGAGRFATVARAPAHTWDPIPLVEMIGLTQPSAEQLRWLLWTTQASLGLVIVGLWTSVALGVAFVLQLVQEGLLNCFGKVTHSTIPLLHAMAFFALAPCGGAWSVDAWLRRRRLARSAGVGVVFGRGAGAHPAVVSGKAQTSPPFATTSRFVRWPFELLFVELAFYYFDAGLSKLVTSGLAWADGYTLQYYLMRLGGDVGQWVATQLWLCVLLSAGALLFELCFPLAIFLRRLRPWFLAAGVCFHLGNHVMLDLIFWPVLAVYPLVVPFSDVRRWLRNRFTGATPRAAGDAGATLAASA